jgi:hypothetical protein
VDRQRGVHGHEIGEVHVHKSSVDLNHAVLQAGSDAQLDLLYVEDELWEVLKKEKLSVGNECFINRVKDVEPALAMRSKSKERPKYFMSARNAATTMAEDPDNPT